MNIPFHPKQPRAASAQRPVEVVSVVPPRTGERTLLGIENLLQALAVPEPFALELAGTGDGVSFLVRTASALAFRRQLSVHYPQARIESLPPENDPLRVKPRERAWTQVLGLAGPEFLPLRTFKDDDLLDAGSDPLLAILGALGAVGQGERVVARLVLHPLGVDWSRKHQRRALVPALSPILNPAYQYQTRTLIWESVALIPLLGLVAVGLQSYLWLQEGHLLWAVLLDLAVAAGVVAAIPLLVGLYHRATRLYDNRLVQEKVSRAAYRAELHLTAIVPEGQGQDRAEALLLPLATAYHHYDLASGNAFQDGAMLPAMLADPLALSNHRPFASRTVLNTREVASLWHLPRGGEEVPLMERTGARLLVPLARGVRDGALVGSTTSYGEQREVRFPDDLLRQHHLYVAKTRMGKSTLMQHVVAYKLRRKAQGQDGDAIVVIDPHSDLVRALLTLVPRELVEDVYLVDLADQERSPGINILDTHLFPDRDRATDNVIQVVKNLWEQWGPRMQSILEHTLKSLYEANRHPSVTRDQQYTILDGLHLLADEDFRREVLTKVHDPYLIRWWARDFRDWHRQYRADAVAPVQTRLAYYASSERARAILGQSQSTLDLADVVRGGKILLVSTAQGQVGREVSALIGGTLLNLLDGVVRSQESLPIEERRRVLVVVDEMQSIPGADYEGMLSELGKFGGSFILATQSLKRLEELSESLRETLFSNIGCLVTFQMSAYDARYLTWEMDRDIVTEEDLVSLPAHHCYVRATVNGEKLPTFSMALRPPLQGDPAVAQEIRQRSASYTRSREEVSTRLERSLEAFIHEFREDLEQRAAAAKPGPAPKGAGQETGAGRRQRSHRKKGRPEPQLPDVADQVNKLSDTEAVGDMQDEGMVSDFLGETDP